LADMYDIIQALLNQKDLNKRQLAKLADIPYSSLISAFNRRSESFSSSHLQKIASALEVTVDDILEHTSHGEEKRFNEIIDTLEDMGFSFEYDDNYNLYGNLNLLHEEQGISISINQAELMSFFDNISKDSEYYRERYIKRRLFLEFGNEE